MTLPDLAGAFAVAPSLLTHHVDQWLTADLWEDRRLAQDFRAALLSLCLSRLEPDGRETAEPVMQWLRGEKVAPASLRAADISVRMSRTNARAMLVSLCHFLRKAGAAGLLVVLDARRLACTAAGDGMLRYSPAAVMDAYEVLAGDSSTMPSTCLACSWRFWPTRRWPPAIRAARWPIRGAADAGLARCAAGRPAEPGGPAGVARSMTLEARTAIEALRAGVPNRAAVRQMGTEQTEIEHAFEAALSAAWADAVAGARPERRSPGHRNGRRLRHRQVAPARLSGRSRAPTGIRGQPHRRQQGNPAVASRHVFAAALRDAALPDRPDDPIAACVTVLREQPEALDGDGNRHQHARCRVRADLCRLPVPCAPRVHAT